MWYFQSPRIVFGEDALSHLDELQGERAFIVTDRTVDQLGFAQRVREHLATAGVDSRMFVEVEPDPSIETVRRCAAAIAAYEPDWIVGLGGGSSIDTAKAAWLVYERPDVELEGINPFEHYGLGSKARLIAIPTTSGTGAEVTSITVLTNKEEQSKLGMASFEIMPHIAIVDPTFVTALPPRITADTGLDALTHAVEGYTSAYHNDFCDGLCLNAIRLVFAYLPRAYANPSETQARERMHNAATIAGLAFGNSMPSLAHAMGHALGAVFHTPHGRAVSLFLPYTILFTANGQDSRYAEIARFMGWEASDEREAARRLVAAIHKLQRTLDQPLSIAELNIARETFEEVLPKLTTNAETDTSLVMSTRIPTGAELTALFRYAYDGRAVDF